MKFHEAYDELISTLVAGGMDEATAKRKLRNWTRRIEDRTMRYVRERVRLGHPVDMVVANKRIRNN